MLTAGCPAHTCAWGKPPPHRICSQVRLVRRVSAAAYKLTSADGKATDVSKPVFLVGSDASADLQVQSAAARHAEFTQKGKQVFVKALVGDFVLDSTSTWIDGEEARSNVSYVLASGAKVAFGSPDNSYTVTFEEPTGANPLVEMMMQGMAAGASKEVKDALGSNKA